MTHVAIGITAYTPHDVRCVVSLMDLSARLAREQIRCETLAVYQDPDFAHAMNGLLARFLASDAERILFIDSDISFLAIDAFELLTSPFDFVGGNYARKSIGGGMASTPKPKGRRHGNVLEADMVGTGFLCLSRKAVESMIQAGCQAYESDGMLVHALVTSGPLDGQWRAGDEMLCRRWQRLGEVAWIDTSIQLEHIGAHAFTERTA